MKKALTVAIMLSILLSLSFAEAQAPTPPNVPTLGPVIICSAGDSGNNIEIVSPVNQSNYSGEIHLIFTTVAVGMFGQFGNVGYSLDGGIITSVRSFATEVDKTGGPDWYWWKTTASANVVLPALPDGVHNVTVCYGWQYLGVPANPSLERFEVYAYETVDFTVGNYDDAPTDTQSPNPSPTVPESSTSPSPIPTATSSQSGAELTMNGLNQVETWGLYALLVVVALLLVIALVIKEKSVEDFE